MTTTAECPVCGAPQAQGLLDDHCTTRLERDLGDVAAIVAELDITISKQAKIGNASGPGGLARERTPVNWGAAQVADDLQNTLTTWARDVDSYTDAHLGRWASPSQAAAACLLNHIDAIRRHPAVNELVDEVTDAIQQARRVVDRPADRIYLGQCFVENPDEDGEQVTCMAELYARPTAFEVQCRVCGTEHPVAERRAWLLKRAEDMLFTVQQAAQMVGEVGHIRVTEAAIRGYIHRKRIAYRPGGKLIRLGDLLEVVLDEGERKSA